jgi:hypothetical protein
MTNETRYLRLFFTTGEVFFKGLRKQIKLAKIMAVLCS